MKTYRRLTSLLLLLILGSVLGAEAVGYLDAHSAPCSEVVISSHLSSNESASTEPALENAAIDCNHSEHHSASSKCSDPCHTGQSHFGHSLYNTSQANMYFLSGSSSDIKNSASSSATQGPVIEGPRKPPRKS